MCWTKFLFSLCFYLFLSVVLSGLCSNDCPEKVKVSSALLSLAQHSTQAGMACVWHPLAHTQSVPLYAKLYTFTPL